MRFLKTHLALWYFTCGDSPKRLHVIYLDPHAQMSQISANANALN